MFPIYPYHNIEDFNLDWIIKLIKKLEKEIDTFTALTKITWAGEWDITKYYTQWSLVDDNGNGYISIKPVPRNVPITDTNYWVLVADYSALYAAFSQRITDLENAVDNIDNTEIPALQNSINTINNTINTINNTTIPAINSDITALESKVDSCTFNDDSVILVLADSYGLTPVGPEGQHGYPYYMNAVLPNNQIYVLSEGGMGFIHPGNQGNYPEDLLNNWSGDKTSITDIVCTLGLNDTGTAMYPYSENAWVTAFNSCINNMKSNYPNARIHVGVAGWDLNMSGASFLNFEQIVSLTTQLATYHGIYLINNVQYLLHISNFMQSDDIHPNDNGARRLANFIVNHLKGHSMSVSYLTEESVTIGGQTKTWTIKVNNNHTQIHIPNSVNFTAIAMTGSSVQIGTISNPHYAYRNIPAAYIMSYNVPIKLTVEGSAIFAQSTSSGSLSTIYATALQADTIGL